MIKIERIVPALPFKSNSKDRKIFRVIGTVDIEDKGTRHEITCIDPFIFLDEACMTQEGTTFSKHPHSGLTAISYILDGEIEAWDNINGTGETNNKKGGLYYINSGKGIVHSEAGVNLKNDLHWLQLWINPGVHQHPLPKAFSKLVEPNDIPEYCGDEFTVRTLIGSYDNVSSPVDVGWPIIYLHVVIAPQAVKVFDLKQKNWNGFIYIIDGEGTFGANESHGKSQECLEFNTSTSSTLKVQNDRNKALNLMIALGKPHGKEFYKLLGHGGAIVADSKSSAHASMREYESDPDNYGI